MSASEDDRKPSRRKSAGELQADFVRYDTGKDFGETVSAVFGG